MCAVIPSPLTGAMCVAKFLVNGDPGARRGEEVNRVKFGVFLPSFIQGEPQDQHARRLRDFARHAEDLGFDSLWITDHIVTAHRFYSVSWLDSLITLAHVAAITERVRLGTSIL